MYLRAVHAESSIPVLRGLIREFPLGIITTAIASDVHPLIQSSHVPFVLDVQDETSDTELGVLRGHLARVNPQVKAMIASLPQSSSTGTDGPTMLEQEVQILFQSPAQHYVTPKFYTHTKPNTGKVVPTWNYAAVQAYGRVKLYHNSHSPESGNFLAKQIDDISKHSEEQVMGFDGTAGNQTAWKVADAPPSYVQALSKAIVGIEIKLDRLEGKFKMSQEMGAEDRDGVAKGFAMLGTEVGASVAKLVEERGRLKALQAQS